MCSKDPRPTSDSSSLPGTSKTLEYSFAFYQWFVYLTIYSKHLTIHWKYATKTHRSTKSHIIRLHSGLECHPREIVREEINFAVNLWVFEKMLFRWNKPIPLRKHALSPNGRICAKYGVLQMKSTVGDCTKRDYPLVSISSTVLTCLNTTLPMPIPLNKGQHDKTGVLLCLLAASPYHWEIGGYFSLFSFCCCYAT